MSEENRREVGKLFTSLTSSDPSDPVISSRELHTWGRTIVVPESTSKIAKFRFDDLCGKPLSAADYIEVTKAFGTVFLLDVPKMGLDLKDKVWAHLKICFWGTGHLMLLLGTAVYNVY